MTTPTKEQINELYIQGAGGCACEKCKFCVVEKKEIREPVSLPEPRTFLGIPIETYNPIAIIPYLLATRPTGKFRKEFWCVAMPEKIQITGRKATCTYFKKKQKRR